MRMVHTLGGRRFLAFGIANVLLGAGLLAGPAARASGSGNNADTVDGFHAVKCSTPVASRGGVLVATCSNGHLPNNIIVVAPDSKKLSGKTLTQLIALARDPSVVQHRVSGTCPSDRAIRIVQSDGSVGCSSRFWRLGGNSKTDPLTNFIGTTDDQPLVIKVDGQRVMLYQPTTGTPNVVGGLELNSTFPGVQGATIAGGGQNSPTSCSACLNAVTGDFGAVGGGRDNSAGPVAFIGGGQRNSASGVFSTVSGGSDGLASGSNATIAGGLQNVASGESATVGGGAKNHASGGLSTVAGGSFNTASGFLSFAVGAANNATGSLSAALGNRANADDDGAFVWADHHESEFHSNEFPCITQFNNGTNDICDPAPTSGVNTFNVRATGGVRFVTSINESGAPTEGCYIDSSGNLFCSGTVSTLSDRRAKRGVRPVRPGRVLRKVATLPVTTWSYRGSDHNVRHMGPMAQDFSRVFSLGATSSGIAVVDAQGVAFAAIKGLYAKLQSQKQTIAAQHSRIRSLAKRVSALDRAVKKLERAVGRENAP
jgi:hypothetical protein